MDSIKGKCASSCVAFGYNNQFCVPEVTSVFFSSCDSLVGDSLEFNQAIRGSLCLIGKTQLLWTQCRVIGPHLVARGKSHGFSRVAAGTWGIFSSYDGNSHSITGVCLLKSGDLSRYDGHLGKLN